MAGRPAHPRFVRAERGAARQPGSRRAVRSSLPVHVHECCNDHEHQPGLPDVDLREHVLASVIRTAEAELAKHGYAYPVRSLEVLHVAMEDALDLDNQQPRRYDA